MSFILIAVFSHNQSSDGAEHSTQVEADLGAREGLGFGVQNSPVQGDGRHGVDAGEDGGDGEEVVKLAVEQPVVPLIVDGIGEVHHRVEGGHGGFGKSQVHQEVVGDGAHPLVSQDDPHHHHVPHHRHHHDEGVGDSPQGHLPRGLHKLVREGLVQGAIEQPLVLQLRFQRQSVIHHATMQTDQAHECFGVQVLPRLGCSRIRVRGCFWGAGSSWLGHSRIRVRQVWGTQLVWGAAPSWFRKQPFWGAQLVQDIGLFCLRVQPLWGIGPLWFRVQFV